MKTHGVSKKNKKGGFTYPKDIEKLRITGEIEGIGFQYVTQIGKIATSQNLEQSISTYREKHSINYTDFEFVEVQKNSNAVLFKKGSYTLSQSIKIPKDKVVIIAPGFRLNLTENASIISQSTLIAKGTKQEPIAFFSDTSTGGGIFVNDARSRSEIAYCTFDNLSNPNNEIWSVSGAINFNESDVTISNCVFKNNISSDKGGAIVAGNSANVNISGSLFNGNSATRGGAIAVTGNGVDFVLNNSTFVNNTATSSDGGAMYLGGANANSSITNTTVFNNKVIYTTLNQSRGGGIRIEGTRPFTISNSLIYGNVVDDGTGTNTSDIGLAPLVELTLDHSITKTIIPVLTEVGDGSDEFSTSIIEADLTSSNLMFMTSSGYVEYNSVSSSEDSPIDFGSDGNDAGSWDSGLALSLDKQDVLAANVLVFHNKPSNSIEIIHTISTPLTVEVFSILGTKLLDLKNVTQRQSIQANSLATGIYILKGKSNGKSFSKKFIIN